MMIPMSILMNRALGAIGIIWGKVITEGTMAVVGILIFAILLRRADKVSAAVGNKEE